MRFQIKKVFHIWFRTWIDQGIDLLNKQLSQCINSKKNSKNYLTNQWIYKNCQITAKKYVNLGDNKKWLPTKKGLTTK